MTTDRTPTPRRPTSHSYYSQRLRLHYLDWGNAAAPHLLLVHGVQDHCHTWDWFADAFVGDYHAVAPDLRGHGDSEWVLGSGYHMMDYVYDLAQLVRQARLEPLVVVGHSMGGTIALVAQPQSATWAKRIVLIDPSIWVPSEPEVEARFIEAYRQPITQEAIMRANPTWHPSDAAHKVEALENASPEIAIQTVRQNDPWNVAREVAQVSVPTLILGADPRLQPRVPALLGESLAAINARVAFQVVPHASHSMHRDEYEETLRLIRDWVGSDADRIEHEA